MERFQLVLWFLSLLVPVLNLWGLFWALDLQLVSTSSPCSIIFSVLLWNLTTYLSYHLKIILLCGPPVRHTQLFDRFSFFYWLSLGFVIWLRLGDLLLSQNPDKFVSLILPDGLFVVHVPLVRVFIFEFLAQFRVDTFPLQSCRV